jgi:hypothetical protein
MSDTMAFHSAGIRGSCIHSNCGGGVGLSQNECRSFGTWASWISLARLSARFWSSSSVTRSSTLTRDDVGWQYGISILSEAGFACFLCLFVWVLVPILVFLSLSPPLGRDKNSSSLSKTLGWSAGSDGMLGPSPLSVTSSTVALGLGSHSLTFSEALYLLRRPSVSFNWTRVAGKGLPSIITLFVMKLSMTLCCRMKGVPTIMS